MKKITRISLTVSIGLLNAFAVWNTCSALSGNFGSTQKRVETEIQKFESKLNADAIEFANK